jgi:hypothetical protein
MSGDKSKFIGRMVAAAKARQANQRVNVSGVRARRERREAAELRGEGEVETFVTQGYKRAIQEIARGGTASVSFGFDFYTLMLRWNEYGFIIIIFFLLRGEIRLSRNGGVLVSVF